jgi:hypothetical protein
MFVKLFGKQNAVRREPDKIWKTRLLEFEGLLALIESLNRDVTHALVIAHFPSTFRSLNDLLASKAVAFESYPTALEGVRLGEIPEYHSQKCHFTVVHLVRSASFSPAAGGIYRRTIFTSR